MIIFRVKARLSLNSVWSGLNLMPEQSQKVKSVNPVPDLTGFTGCSGFKLNPESDMNWNSIQTV